MWPEAVLDSAGPIIVLDTPGLTIDLGPVGPGAVGAAGASAANNVPDANNNVARVIASLIWLLALLPALRSINSNYTGRMRSVSGSPLPNVEKNRQC